jgi:hypothetical protein
VPSSKIIGFRIPIQDLFLWEQYYTNRKWTLSKFIKESVNEYINPGDKADFDNYDFKLNPETKLNIPGKKYINLRITDAELIPWDEYCKYNKLDRTQLILEATRYKMDPTRKRQSRDYSKIKKILNNVIKEWGLIDYRSLTTIFDSIDSSEITNMLNDLEKDYLIMRKGQEVYTATQESDINTDVRYLIEYFTRFLDSIENQQLFDSSTTIFQNELERSEIESLNIVIFEYLYFVTKNIGITANTEETDEILKQIRSVESVLASLINSNES